MKEEQKKSVGIRRVTSSTPLLVLMICFKSFLKSTSGTLLFINVLNRMSVKLRSKLGSFLRKERKKDYANKITPVCVNKGRNLHLVQAPGKPPPSN